MQRSIVQTLKGLVNPFGSNLTQNNSIFIIKNKKTSLNISVIAKVRQLLHRKGRLINNDEHAIRSIIPRTHNPIHKPNKFSQPPPQKKQ
jgi:hypothetical protein